MIEEIFSSVSSYGSKSRNKKEWDMVFDHLHSALLCINTQAELVSFKKHFYSYIGKGWFTNEHPISMKIQSLLNQETRVLDTQIGLDYFKEKHELFFKMVKITVAKEKEEFDEEWKRAVNHSKNGGMWPALFYLDY